MGKYSIEQICERFGIIAESTVMKEILHVAQQVAASDITVLVTGESGTGKEIIANAIHGLSVRAEKPMISVNCGAIPEGIIESELFGHEKGAFTSATESRKGYFELADGGTIFLDEIGELPPQTQVKFLRILENGEYMRVGSGSTKRVDVRVIAATNKDIEQEVRTRRFRADLYFRLRSVNIKIPPLRERPEDIIPIARKMAEEYARSSKMSFGGFEESAYQALLHYEWPGNVRELKNIVESLIVLEAGRVITGDDVRRFLSSIYDRFSYADEQRSPFLPVHLNVTSEQAERELIYRALLEMKKDILELKNYLMNRYVPTHPVQLLPPAEQIISDDIDNQAVETLPTMEEMERTLINEALKRSSGRRREAAKALKISERTLYRKIKEYGL
jgi:transcriptional regulator with PAS, ATPase and Fis domain